MEPPPWPPPSPSFLMSGFGLVLNIVFRVTLPTILYSTLCCCCCCGRLAALPPPAPPACPGLPTPRPPSGVAPLPPPTPPSPSAWPPFSSLGTSTRTFLSTRRGLGSEAGFPSSLWFAITSIGFPCGQPIRGEGQKHPTTEEGKLLGPRARRRFDFRRQQYIRVGNLRRSYLGRGGLKTSYIRCGKKKKRSTYTQLHHISIRHDTKTQRRTSTFEKPKPNVLGKNPIGAEVYLFRARGES